MSVILIDTEQMLVTAVSNNTLTVQRGYNGTTGAMHNAGAGVYPAFDQRGEPRLRNGQSDIGAFEFQPTPLTLADNGPNPSTFGQAVGFTVNVTGGIPNGERVSLEDASNGNAVVGLGTLSNDSATISVSGLTAGTHNLFAVYGGDTNYLTGVSSQVSQAVNLFTTTAAVSDSGGTYTGSAFPATATVTGLSGVPGSTLEGVGLTFTYYAGTSANGTGSSIAPTSAGTYTVAASFAGSADYASASAAATFTIALPPEFVYNQTAETLVITLIPSLPNFQYTQVTTDNGGTTSSVYTFTLSGSSAPTVSQAFPSALLTTAPTGGGASVAVTGQGLAGTAILITNDTYLDPSGNKLETPERISLGSLTDAGAGTLSKFVGNNTGSPEYTFLSLENFPVSYAYAGRNDGTIQLYGTEGTGKVGFVTAGYYSYIASAVTGVYAHFGEGTPEVIGTGAGNAADFAYHYTSSSPSTVSAITSAFTVNGISSSSMSGSQTNPEDGGAIDTFNNVALGFVLNTAVSYTGNSIAYINDSRMSDTYVGDATDPLGLAIIGGVTGFSYMYVGAFPNFNEFDVAYGFGTYYATSTMGGDDIAYPGVPANNVFSGDWVRTF